MACFLVPAAEAVAVTLISRGVKARERKAGLSGAARETEEKLPLSRKLRWLTNLLWGGSALLAFEHLWHGEIAPWFPFLTAAGSPGGLWETLYEMATAGVTMALLVTAVWGVMLLAVRAMERGAGRAPAAE